MKKETFRRLLVVLFLGVLTFGLYAELSNTQCYNEVEGYIWYSGGRTWYRIVGVDKPGIPMILLHGGPGVNSWYMEPMKPLANERPIIYYDQRGGGYSDPLEDPADWNVEFFVEELRALIQQLGYKKIHIFGHSWGTMLGTDYVLTYPEGVQSLILSSSAISVPQWAADQRVLLTYLPEDVQEVIYWHEENQIYDSPEYLEAMSVYYNLYLCRLDPWPDILVKSLDAENMDIYGAMWGASEFTCNGTLQDYDRTPQLHLINVPTLFTCGKYDEATPEATAYYKSLVPGAQMKVFKKSSHTAMLEQPIQFNNTIRKFLRSVEKKHKK